MEAVVRLGFLVLCLSCLFSESQIFSFVIVFSIETNQTIQATVVVDELRNKGELEKDDQVRFGFTNRAWTTVGHAVK